MHKKLSIITPYYNTLEYTKKLAKTLSSQLTDEVEWIIVDDGCHEKELDTFPATIIHLSENSGNASMPRNVGLDMAVGDFIAFIDSDDMVTTNYIDEILNKMDAEDFDYCYIGWKYGDNIVIIEEEPLDWNRCVWNCIYKRELIGNNRFNCKYNIDEDGDFNERVRRGKRANIKEVLYIYTWNEREDSLVALYTNGKLDGFKQE